MATGCFLGPDDRIYRELAGRFGVRGTQQKEELILCNR